MSVSLPMRVLAVLVAILWLPASAHCQIEAFTGLEFLACGESGHEEGTHKEPSCEGDTCAEVEGGLYKIEDNSQLAPAPRLALMFELGKLDVLLSLERSLVRPAASPPDTGQHWLFATRSAAPPRAPTRA